MAKDVSKSKSSSRQGKHGEKMIEIKLRFWTNGIASKKGDVKPKHAWSNGVVRIEPNETHGIKPGSPKPFGSLLDVGAIIEKVLIEQEITLHPSTKMKKYIAE